MNAGQNKQLVYGALGLIVFIVLMAAVVFLTQGNAPQGGGNPAPDEKEATQVEVTQTTPSENDQIEGRYVSFTAPGADNVEVISNSYTENISFTYPDGEASVRVEPRDPGVDLEGQVEPYSAQGKISETTVAGEEAYLIEAGEGRIIATEIGPYLIFIEIRGLGSSSDKLLNSIRDSIKIEEE